jgi:membrane protein implicated in regulation of membrane protease activity
MLGAFLALGVDTLVIVAALWYVGRLSDRLAGAVSAAVLSVFALWVGVRWLRLRLGRPAREDANAAGADEDDPLARLKRRYADGELSDTEFEARLDTLLDADSRVESAEDIRRSQALQPREHSRESE